MPKTEIAINSQKTLPESVPLKINGVHSDFSNRVDSTLNSRTFRCKNGPQFLLNLMQIYINTRIIIRWTEIHPQICSLFHSLDYNNTSPSVRPNHHVVDDEDDNGQRNPLKMISTIYVTKYDNGPALRSKLLQSRGNKLQTRLCIL